MDESFQAALIAPDNGEAAAEGQRARRAFPKGFMALLYSFLWGLGPCNRDHANQVFNSDLMRLSNSSKFASTIMSPLTKKGRGSLDLQHLGGERLSLGREQAEMNRNRSGQLAQLCLKQLPIWRGPVRQLLERDR